ncbi:hypothetical protein PoB_000625700 [Plakobranchus ocellatus]|uniref:Uncharacterized protein n=1 Tax=Plakobranchus ocellatus TaxID=259542 RepID=A0AAV3YBD5_9GAST|nr:hypothetical protein PoB_000625700 [Plakobranchus ocellatus]
MDLKVINSKPTQQRTTFIVKVTSGERTPKIWNVKLLPGGRLLLADNTSVKLFTTQGQHLHTLECRSEPHRLAVLDSSSIRHTSVAVTLPFRPGIDILEVGVYNMKLKRNVQTSRRYLAVAALNNQTLAVGYVFDSGIDLIDLGGQVLREIDSSVVPHYMDITEDGDLMCSTKDNTIARVELDCGTIVFNKSG